MRSIAAFERPPAWFEQARHRSHGIDAERSAGRRGPYHPIGNKSWPRLQLPRGMAHSPTLRGRPGQPRTRRQETSSRLLGRQPRAAAACCLQHLRARPKAGAAYGPAASQPSQPRSDRQRQAQQPGAATPAAPPSLQASRLCQPRAPTTRGCRPRRRHACRALLVRAAPGRLPPPFWQRRALWSGTRRLSCRLRHCRVPTTRMWTLMTALGEALNFACPQRLCALLQSSRAVTQVLDAIPVARMTAAAHCP